MPSSTLYLDASYDSKNYRSEFRFPKQNGVYKTDMRLVNLGLAKTSNGNTNANMLVGMYGVIQTLSLYSGSQLIDEIREFSTYMALKSLMHSNSENQSISRVLQRNKLGYSAEGNDDLAGPNLNVFISNDNPNEYNTIYGADASTKAKKSNGTWLDLKVLPFIDATPYVPMNVYPDLRLVVTYKPISQLQKYVLNRSNDFETLPPLLVCEYENDPIIAEALMKNYQPVAWESVEQDQVYLPASAVGQDAVAQQSESWVIKGFNGKYVSKMVVVNTSTAEADHLIAPNTSNLWVDGSRAQFQWQLQMRLNGAQFFPTPYIEGPNRRLGKMVDAWGDLNLLPYQQSVMPSTDVNELFYDRVGESMGRMDYTGYLVNDVCSEMKLSVIRNAVGRTAGSADANIGQRQALRLNVFGISRKQVVPTSKGILVRYV